MAQLARRGGFKILYINQETMWVQIPPAASKVVKGSPQNLDKGETIYPHPPLMTDAPENTITMTTVY